MFRTHRDPSGRPIAGAREGAVTVEPTPGHDDKLIRDFGANVVSIDEDNAEQFRDSAKMASRY